MIDGVRNLTELNEEQRNNILCESPIAELCMWCMEAFIWLSEQAFNFKRNINGLSSMNCYDFVHMYYSGTRGSNKIY